MVSPKSGGGGERQKPHELDVPSAFPNVEIIALRSLQSVGMPSGEGAQSIMGRAWFVCSRAGHEAKAWFPTDPTQPSVGKQTGTFRACCSGQVPPVAEGLLGFPRKSRLSSQDCVFSAGPPVFSTQTGLFALEALIAVFLPSAAFLGWAVYLGWGTLAVPLLVEGQKSERTFAGRGGNRQCGRKSLTPAGPQIPSKGRRRLPARPTCLPSSSLLGEAHTSRGQLSVIHPSSTWSS